MVFRHSFRCCSLLFSGKKYGKILEKVSHAAFKDSDKDETLISHTPVYLCGGDSLIYDFWQKGAKGVVSVMGNYAPSLVMKIWQELQNGEMECAKKTQEKICEIADCFRKQNQIARIKYALSRILENYPQEISLPFLSADNETKKEIDRLFDKGILR